MHWIDPNCLPETRGAVEGFIVNRHGEIDGLLLAGPRPTSLLVCMPPHLAAAIEAEVKHGDAIRVRGVRPRLADIIAAVALTARNGAVIVDDGPGGEDEHEPPHRDGKPQRMEADGIVRLSLYGPKGELRGALLEDGTVIRIGAKEAASIPGIAVPRRVGRGSRRRFAHQTRTGHRRRRDWARPAQYEAGRSAKAPQAQESSTMSARTLARHVDKRPR